MSNTQIILIFKLASVSWLSEPQFASYDQFEVTSTSIKVSWIPAKNTGFAYSSEVNYCERNDAAVQSSDLTKYPILMNHTYFVSQFQSDTYWTNCQTVSVSTQLSYTFTGLTSGKPYRFYVRQVSSSTAGNTDWSDVIIIPTLLSTTMSSHEYATIYARGTGARNHQTSQVKVDSNTLFKHSLFRGLHLTILDRKTLAKLYSNTYDTMETQDSTTYNSGSTIAYTSYTIDSSSFTYTTSTTYSKTYTRPNDFYVSHQLATKIKEYYDYKYIIILVSGHAWELNFSKQIIKIQTFVICRELSDLLMSCGAYNIMEFGNHYSPRFGKKTTVRNIDDEDPIEHTNFYHPYAFIGIPGLPPGLGFEQLRTNQGYHMSVGTQAYAELRVRMRFNKFTGMYSFDNYQYHDQTHFLDSYAQIHKAKDRSLYATYPYLVAINMTSFNDWDISIYINNDNAVYWTNATGNYTKADTLYFQSGEYPYRIDQLGNTNEDYGTGLVWHTSKSYYDFVDNFLYTDDDRECAPPYTDYTNDNCFDYSTVSSNRPEIFKCYTGLLPYYCDTLSFSTVSSFSGYS